MLRIRVLAAAVVVAMAACGGSGSASGGPSSPTVTLGQEWPAVKSAVQAATSVAVSGNFLMNGKRESLDIILTNSGSLSGSVTVAGHTVTLLVTGGKPYVKINSAFLQQA